MNNKNHKKLYSQIEILKQRFPNLGISCNKTPMAELVEIFNTSTPPVMQFKPKTSADMTELAMGIKKDTISYTSFHLPSVRFDESTGLMERKNELIDILKISSDELSLVTMHLGWKNANAILDESGNFNNTDLSNIILNELLDLFIAGLESNKIMTIENVRYRTPKYDFPERFGDRPEHLIMTRNVIAEKISQKISKPIDKILSNIGYTFDVGHAVGNAHLSEQYTIETWLKALNKDIKIMHIHDMCPMKKDGVPIEKTHLALGDGIIDWKSFFEMKNHYCPNIPMVLELIEEDIIKSIDYLSTLA